MDHLGYAVIAVIALSITKNLYFVVKNTLRDYRKKKQEKKEARLKAIEEQKVIDDFKKISFC